MPKVLETKLKRKARKMKLGGADAYVYGALCKTGWKPKKKKRSMLGSAAKILQ